MIFSRKKFNFGTIKIKEMKILKTSLALLVMGQLAIAQNKKYTMNDAVMGLRSNLAIKNISQFTWANGQNEYLQRVNNAYLKTNLQTMKQDTLVSFSRLNPELKTKLKSLPYFSFEGDKIYWKNGNEFYQVEQKSDFWDIKSWFNLPKNAENIHLIAEKNGAVFTDKNNLFYHENGKTQQITNDTDENIINGQSVHRNEFGINGGIFIAPSKNKVAFYRMNQTMVEDYPIVDWSSAPAKNTNIKYPMAGRKSHEVTLGVYDFRTQKTIFVQTEGDKEQYLTAVSWSPDSKFIFIAVLNRDQNHMKFNQYDAETGRFIKTLFEEKSDKYVEPQHAVTFLPNSNTDFIWQSQRTGYNHLFLYNINKGLVAQLTSGDWLVNDLLGFNADKKEIYFSSTKETPLEEHLYKVNWQNKKITRIDNAKGVHYGILSKDGNWLYDVYSNAETPRVANLINTQTLQTKNLLTAENPLKDYAQPEVKNITLKADDGTPLYGKLILPTDFDTSKKYPVIVYLYGGPHAQLITNSFPASGNLWYDYMAQNGYVVFSMDGRGSSNRGLKFEQATFRNLGDVEMKDQMKGVEYLKSLPFVDTDRMGVHGWSFGGFMTTSLMLKYPNVFKVGVAGGPVIDWKMYEIMYTERYMDTPQNNPEGYANTNLLDKVQNLQGKLLMIHGTQDDVVVWQHSVDFLKSAVDKGVQLDYFVYPGHAHNVMGKDRVHLMQKITDYFNLYLKK